MGDNYLDNVQITQIVEDLENFCEYFSLVRRLHSITALIALGFDSSSVTLLIRSRQILIATKARTEIRSPFTISNILPLGFFMHSFVKYSDQSQLRIRILHGDN